MNCMNAKVKKAKAKLEEERYAAKMKAMTPEEQAAFARRGREALRLFAAAKSSSTLAGTQYTNILKSKEK